MRVVNVSSRLEARSRLDADMLAAAAAADPAARKSSYADSKRALMLWVALRAGPLSERGTRLAATTPGMVDTQLGRHSVRPQLWPLTKPLRWLLLRSPAEGAVAACAAGLQPPEGGGPGGEGEAGWYMDGERTLEHLPTQRALSERPLAEAVCAWVGRVCGEK